jgi:hypothetical protein
MNTTQTTIDTITEEQISALRTEPERGRAAAEAMDGGEGA